MINDLNNTSCEATEDLEVALKSGYQIGLGHRLLNRAEQLEEEGRYEEAEKFYCQAVSAFEKNPDALLWLARALSGLAKMASIQNRSKEAEFFINRWRRVFRNHLQQR